MSLTMADYGTVCTPGRSSARLKARKVFSMPSRDEVLGKIQVDRTPHKSLDHFRPRKLIHDFVKGHNRYNNTDPVSLWEDGAMSDFIVDDEEEVGEEESDDTASSAESQSNDSGDEEEEESSDDDVKRGRNNTTSQVDRPVLRKRRKSKQISSSEESGEESIKESHKVESDRNRRARRNCVSKRRVVSTTKVKVDSNHNERIKGKVGNVKIQDNGDVDELEDEESFVTLRRGHRKKKSQLIESSEDDIGSGENEQEDTDEEDQINRPHRKRKKTIESSDESDGDECQVASPTTTQHKRAANRRHHYELRGTRFPKDKTQTVEKNSLEKSCQKKTPVEDSGREAGSDSDEELSFNTLRRGQRRKRRATIESSEDDLDSGEKEQEETDEANQTNKPPMKMKKALESSDESDGDEHQVSSSTTMQHKRAANSRHHYELRGTRFPKDKTQTVEKNLLEKSCQKKMPVEASGREAGSDSDEELSFKAPRGQRRKRRATIESSDDDLDSEEKEQDESL